jgi:hypothetical protein
VPVPPAPPIPAPPLLVDEVPDGGGIVALLEEELADEDELVVVGDELVVAGLVDVFVDVVDELLDELELELDVEPQSWAASALTVPAPWPRFWSSVVLTVCGS